MNTVELLQDFINDLPGIGIRAVGNAALSIGLRSLTQVLKSPVGTEGEEIASRMARSAADWYTLSSWKLDTLPTREKMYAIPQDMPGMIEFLLKEREIQEPTAELLKAVGVTKEEYEEIASQVLKEQRDWLEENRVEIETRWEDLVNSSNGYEGDLVSAATEIAGRILSRIDRIRVSRLKAFARGYKDALSELALLKAYETRLFEAWKKEGGRDDDLLL
jgi:hypothetical protein